jgi:hypothetical protein
MGNHDRYWRDINYFYYERAGAREEPAPDSECVGDKRSRCPVEQVKECVDDERYLTKNKVLGRSLNERGVSASFML